MQIHGLRIYPNSVKRIQGAGAPIYIHGSLEEDRSDFDLIFAPIYAALQTRLVITEYAASLDEDGQFADPRPDLTNQYGAGIHSFSIWPGLVALFGHTIPNWGRFVSSGEGALFLVFDEAPPFELVEQFFYGSGEELGQIPWPPSLRAILQCWDGIYWQIFSREREDIEVIVTQHREDTRLALYCVEFEREYPNPSNLALTPV